MRKQSFMICVLAGIVALAAGCASQPQPTQAQSTASGDAAAAGKTQLVCDQSTGSMISRSCHSVPVDSVSADASRQQGATSARQMLNRNGVNTTHSN